MEHLLGHRELLPRLRETGCLFVTTAVESIDDRVLALLEKGHTRRDFFDAVALCRAAGLDDRADVRHLSPVAEPRRLLRISSMSSRTSI